MEKSPLEYSDIVFDAKPDAVPFNYRIIVNAVNIFTLTRLK